MAGNSALGVLIFIGSFWIGKKIASFFTETEDDVIDQEEEQINKIKSVKTGEPITLTGYGIIDKEGNDTGKRFIRKKDAEEYTHKGHKIKANKKL